jgi:hypothetical protein
MNSLNDRTTHESLIDTMNNGFILSATSIWRTTTLRPALRAADATANITMMFTTTVKTQNENHGNRRFHAAV